MTIMTTILAILFVVVVVPLWLVLHYSTRWRQARTLSPERERMLAGLWQTARRLEGRIATLETILDAEAPGWRDRA